MDILACADPANKNIPLLSQTIGVVLLGSK